MAHAAKKTIQVQINRSLDEKGDVILEKLGITPTTVITMFYARLA